jgi:hypothetical protein
MAIANIVKITPPDRKAFFDGKPLGGPVSLVDIAWIWKRSTILVGLESEPASPFGIINDAVLIPLENRVNFLRFLVRVVAG